MDYLATLPFSNGILGIEITNNIVLFALFYDTGEKIKNISQIFKFCDHLVYLEIQ